MRAHPETAAVPSWQRAFVAVGARCEGRAPQLVGSAFFVDAPGRLLVTCCHVIDDIAQDRDAHDSLAATSCPGRLENRVKRSGG